MPTASRPFPIHELKCWPSYFAAIDAGTKTAELRKHDRDYKPRDVLVLREYDPLNGAFTGRRVFVQVTHVTKGGAFGLAEGFSMLSIRHLDKDEARAVAAHLTK